MKISICEYSSRVNYYYKDTEQIVGFDSFKSFDDLKEVLVDFGFDVGDCQTISDIKDVIEEGGDECILL